ncbi:MAG: RNA polymerase sigma factor, partial [Planctomycetes bacterium]|nr:RNA polymerase sigma factor [Planctomycetota bacterium]
MSTRQQSRILERAAELAAGRGYRLAFGLVGNRHDAEESVSKALEVACAKVNSLPRRIWPWLATTITHEARNLRRKAARRGPQEAWQDAPGEDKEDPLEKALGRELYARLWQAFQGLSESEREILALVYLGGLSKRQAARERGVALTTLRREVDAALAKLRQQLGVSEQSLLLALPALVAIPSAGFVAGLGSNLG